VAKRFARRNAPPGSLLQTLRAQIRMSRRSSTPHGATRELLKKLSVPALKNIETCATMASARTESQQRYQDIPVNALSPIVQLDQFNFHQTLAQSVGIALVFFTKRSCNSCRQWRLLLGELTKEPGAPQVFEVDAEQEQPLASEFELFHLPALFLYLDGRYHCPIQSEAKLPSLQAAIENARRHSASEPP
jgi:hypothetical protein